MRGSAAELGEAEAAAVTVTKEAAEVHAEEALVLHLRHP